MLAARSLLQPASPESGVMNRAPSGARRGDECANFQELLGQALIPTNRVEKLLAQAHFHACPHCGPSYRSFVGFFEWCREQRRQVFPYQTMGWDL